MDKYAASFSNAMSGIKNVLKGFVQSKNVGRGLLIGAGMIGFEMFAELVAEFASKKYHIYKSKEYYEKMLRAHPQLKKQKPSEVAKYFNSLNHFAPHVAADPLAAGAYITQSITKLSDEELGGPPPDTFNTLADIEKKIVDAKGGSKSRTAYEKTVGGIIGAGFGTKNN